MKGFIGEFLGTAIMIILGVGSSAGTNLNKTYAQKSNWNFVTISWGLAVTMGGLCCWCIRFFRTFKSCRNYSLCYFWIISMESSNSLYFRTICGCFCRSNLSTAPILATFSSNRAQ